MPESFAEVLRRSDLVSLIPKTDDEVLQDEVEDKLVLVADTGLDMEVFEGELGLASEAEVVGVDVRPEEVVRPEEAVRPEEVVRPLLAR